MYGFTWIISHKSDGNPSAWGCTNGVSVGWINKIEVRGIPFWIKVSESLANDIKMIAMEMHWVLLNPKDTCALYYYLYC